LQSEDRVKCHKLLDVLSAPHFWKEIPVQRLCCFTPHCCTPAASPGHPTSHSKTQGGHVGEAASIAKSLRSVLLAGGWYKVVPGEEGLSKLVNIKYNCWVYGVVLLMVMTYTAW
jgi:hypothetical protein